MTDTGFDLSDPSLWDRGFPEELFAELRRTAPVYHHELTDGVRDRVGSQPPGRERNATAKDQADFRRGVTLGEACGAVRAHRCSSWSAP